MQIDKSKMKKYKATQQFNLNIQVQNKDTPESYVLYPGDEFEFDGLYVVYRSVKGAARSLGRVIGEWFEPLDGKYPPKNETPAISKHIKNDHIADFPKNPSKNIVIERAEESEVSRSRAPRASDNTQDIMTSASKRKRGESAVIVDDQLVARTTRYNDAGTQDRDPSKRKVARKTIPEAESEQEVARVVTGSRMKRAPASTGVKDITNLSNLDDSDTVYDPGMSRRASAGDTLPNLSEVGNGAQARTAAKAPTGGRVVEGQDQGAIIGRVSNRGNKASRTVDGVEISTTVGASQEFEKPGVTVGAQQESIIMQEDGRAAARRVIKASRSNQESLDERSIGIDLGDVVYEGKKWPRLSWQAKIKFIGACERPEVLEAILSSKATDVVLKAARERLSELIQEPAVK